MKSLQRDIRDVFSEASNIKNGMLGPAMKTLMEIERSLAPITGDQGKEIGVGKTLYAHAETLRSELQTEIKERLESGDSYQQFQQSIRTQAQTYLDLISDYFQSDPNPDPGHLDAYVEISPKTKEQFDQVIHFVREAKRNEKPVYHLIHFEDFSENHSAWAQRIRFRTTTMGAEYFLDGIQNIGLDSNDRSSSLETRVHVFIKDFSTDVISEPLIKGNLESFPKINNLPHGRALAFVESVLGSMETFPAFETNTHPFEVIDRINEETVAADHLDPE